MVRLTKGQHAIKVRNTDGLYFIKGVLVEAVSGTRWRRIELDWLLDIDGEEEARLSAQGVLLGWPGAYGMVCDIGGS